MGRIWIKNGTLIDGSGAGRYKADVVIENDRIAKIYKDAEVTLPSEDMTVLDVSGAVVTPGFIDVHRHCDRSPFDAQLGVHSACNPDGGYAEVLLRQGITTTITGNCGISMYPLSQDITVRKQMQDYYAPILGDFSMCEDIQTFPDYMHSLGQVPLAVNTMAMIGIGAVRICVNGFSDRPLTRGQIQMCQAIVEDAMKKGAPGATIGLMYLPECYSTVDELGEILKPLGKYDKILCTHIRGEGDSLVTSVEEVIEIARRAGCKLEISHLKSCGIKNWRKEIYRVIERIDAANARGQKVYCDFYPYDCGSTTLMSLIPPAFVKGDLSAALRRMGTPEGVDLLREMLTRDYEDWDNYVISLGWDKAEISSVSRPENQWMIGKNIKEIAEEGDFKDEVEAASRILLSENGNVAIVIHSMDQQDVDTIAKLPYSIVISDAIYADTNRPHPRMYGAFPHVIRDFVENRRILTLEEAIHKMTGLPAERFGIKNRGVIREGNLADLNIFEEKEFCDNATYQNPTLLPSGLRYCLVNGRIAVDKDRVVNYSLGKILR